MSIGIINYKMGNIGSILNMLKKIGCACSVSEDPSEILKADKLILPGVGAFDEGMKNLKESGMAEVILKKVTEDKVPLLGICLGMQLLGKRSEEGKLPGLGLVDAETVRFNHGLKIPHMGWNTVSSAKIDGLFKNLSENRFYFVHSYHVVCQNQEEVLSETNYGVRFTSSIQKENIYGVQFHPEKSHKFGMQLLRNFVESC